MTSAPVSVAATSTRPRAMRYRPELDGLRGLAVAGVVCYHLGLGWARGGFLGVDVFFVLSGFLITGLLLAEWRAWGSIDLRDFWLRRARRLLPALFVLLLVVALIAHAGASDERGQLRGDMFATLFYVANWHSILTRDSYFDQFQAPSPLLHSWSLGIEEQWYLLFPPLLILVLTITCRSLGVTRAARRVLVVGCLALAGASAVTMSALASTTDPSRAYYGTDTRVQALLIGAALAALLGGDGREPTRLRLRWIGVPALLALLMEMVFVHDTARWMYRGGFLAVATLTALVILGSCRAGSITQRALAFEPMRRLGVISYGVYLWHWPVIVYLDAERVPVDGMALLALRVAATLGLSIASYRLIEQPVRSGALWRRLPAPTNAWLAALATVGVVGAVLVGTSGATTSTAQAFRSGNPVSVRTAGEPLVFTVGDSVPFGLALYFPNDLGFAVQDATSLGCGLIPDRTYADGQPQTLLPACRKWSDTWPADAKAAHPDLGAVFAGEGELFDHEVSGRVVRFGTKAYEAHLDHWLRRSVDALLNAGARRVALVTMPCHADAPGLIGDIVNDTTRIAWVNSVLRRFAATHRATVAVVDLGDHLCANGYTNTMDGVTLRSDGVHFTESGTRVVWDWLGPQFMALLHRSR